MLSLVLLAGCQSLQFYSQAIAGQTRLLLAREPTDQLLVDSEVDAALKARIELVNEVLQFAESRGLDTGGAYRSYVETGSPYVIWNVFAAEPYALTLLTSCFPVAGCVSYRGYFVEEDARRYAALLEEQGYEVFVGGVAAYSTLGWFDDPLLDTFLFRSEERLVALVFHELAHQLVYVKGDTRFNESVATTVEYVLLQDWLEERGQPGSFERFLASRDRRLQVLGLIDGAREKLNLLYDSGVPAAEMDTRKAEIISELRADYERAAATWTEGSEFHHWMNSPINNAKLETVADYNHWVPALTIMLESLGMEGFRTRLQELSRLSTSEREKQLTAAGNS